MSQKSGFTLAAREPSAAALVASGPAACGERCTFRHRCCPSKAAAAEDVDMGASTGAVAEVLNTPPSRFAYSPY